MNIDTDIETVAQASEAASRLEAMRNLRKDIVLTSTEVKRNDHFTLDDKAAIHTSLGEIMMYLDDLIESIDEDLGEWVAEQEYGPRRSAENLSGAAS